MAYKFPTQTLDNLKKDYDAIIVGSGGTGLAAAIQAQQYGLNVAILEKNNRSEEHTSELQSQR